MATRPRHLEPSWRWKPRLESRPTTIFSSLFHRASIFVRPKRSMAVSNNLAPQGWNPEWSRNCRCRLHYITRQVNTRNRHRLSDKKSKHLWRAEEQSIGIDLRPREDTRGKLEIWTDRMRPIGSEILLFRRYSPSVFRSPSTQNFQNNLSRPILRRKRLAAGEDASNTQN